MTKICSRCHRELPESEFYEEKSFCKSCYKRWIRKKSRIVRGKPIETVGELIRELISFPTDAKIVLFDDISTYKPLSVEYIRVALRKTKYDTEEFDNTVVID